MFDRDFKGVRTLFKLLSDDKTKPSPYLLTFIYYYSTKLLTYLLLSFKLKNRMKRGKKNRVFFFVSVVWLFIIKIL